MTHSVDFRRHVLSIKNKEGLTFEQTAKRFSVSVSSLTRWNKNIIPKATRENRPRKVDLKELAKDVETYPDGSVAKFDGWFAYCPDRVITFAKSCRRETLHHH